MKIIAWIMALWMSSDPGRPCRPRRAADGEQAATAGIGIDEKTGQTIPADITLFDENGAEVRLGDLLGRPVILNLVYYTCDRICPQMLEGLARVLPSLSLTPDRQYRVLTVSFDETDTPKLAQSKKNDYMTAIGKPFPESAWRFLTGHKAEHRPADGGNGVSIPARLPRLHPPRGPDHPVAGREDHEIHAGDEV